jgi:hypothetical protein
MMEAHIRSTGRKGVPLVLALCVVVLAVPTASARAASPIGDRAARTSLNDDDRWYLAWQQVEPKFGDVMSSYSALLADIAATGAGTMNNPILIKRATQLRVAFRSLSRELAALPSKTALTKRLTKDVTGWASLFADACDDYVRGFRADSLKLLDIGDAKVNRASALIRDAARGLHELSLTVDVPQPPAVVSTYTGSIRELSAEIRAGDVLTTKYLEAFRASNTQMIRAEATRGLNLYRDLLKKVQAVRPTSGPAELRLIAAHFEKAIDSLRKGYADALNGIQTGNAKLIQRGIVEVQGGTVARSAVTQELLTFALRYS